MLLRFAVTNYASIRDRQELNLVASASLKDKEEKGGVIRCRELDTDVVAAAGIYGANASGKTRMLLALRGMARAVMDSHAKWDPDGGVPRSVRNPFALAEAARKIPTRYEADLVCLGTRYAYSFSVDDLKVVEEELWSFPNGRRRLLYLRPKRGDIRFGRGFPKGIAKFLRPNSLLLSLAAQNNVNDAQTVHRYFSSVRLVHEENDERRHAYATSRVGENDRSSRVLLDLLKSADLGIVGIKKDVRPVPEAVRKAVEQLSGKPRDPGMTMSRLRLLHQSASNEPVSFFFEDESGGTKMMVGLAFPVFQTLESGGLLLVDELDRSLHPLLAERLLDLFLTGNTSGAQIIFSTHAAMLLEKLRRDAVWFTEKQSDGATGLYPLTDFHPRKDESVFRRYLQGRYGAVPTLQSLSIRGRRALD